MKSGRFSRRFIPIQIGLLLIPLFVLGCATHHSDSGTTPIAPAHTAPPPSTQADGMDAAIDPAALLAHRAEQYSKEMEPAIAHHNATATARSNAASQPSQVMWGDPNELRLTSNPPHDSEAITAAAVESSAVAANQASLGDHVMKVDTTAAPQPKAPAPVELAVALPPRAMDATSSDQPPPAAESLEDKLAKRIHDYPHDVSGQLDYQLLQFILDKPVPDLNAISDLPAEDRELVSAVVDGLSNFRNNLRADNNMLLSRKVRPLLELADRLRAQADLTIPTLCLCKAVRGYGNYEPWEGDPPRFSAGADHVVILYCEVQNFSSQLDDKKMWQTQLTQDAVLYTESGMAVWNDKTQDVNDTARNRRQDFFIVQKLKLPSSLVIGRYLLKVSIEDKEAKRVAEATLPLLVVAQ